MTRRDAEGPIHRAVLSWLRVVLPEAVIFHPANESRRPGRAGHVERALNAANGVLPGVPDIIGLTFTGPFFMEVKAPGGVLSPAQKAFRDRLAVLGYGRWAVVRSIDDAKDALARWGIPTREAGALVRLPLRGGREMSWPKKIDPVAMEAMWWRGDRLADIASAFGCSVPAVSKCAVALGLRRNERRRDAGDE